MGTKAITDASFQADVLDSDTPVLVDFWAEWCGPCKMIGPSLEEISDELAGKVVIATHNKGKLVEMRELLAPYGIELTSAGELGLPEPDETGYMFSENAAIKAHAAATASGSP